MDRNKVQSNLQDALSEYFAQTGFNPHSFSLQFNLPESNIYYWLDGTYLPSIENYLILAKAINCSIDYLIGLTDRKTYIKADPPSDFITRFNLLMKDKGCTKYALAKDCGFGRSAISKWLIHGKIPKTENLIKLADYFSCTIDYLIGRSNIK